MKKLQKIAIMCSAILILGSLTLLTRAVNGVYGAAAVEENRIYTLEEMLTYAMQDEYLAYARYSADIEKFGEQRPFTNILKAKKNHIMLLKPLFDKYHVPIAEDRAKDYIVIPSTLLDAMKAGVEGETNNMRMYKYFFKQELPEDVRAAFTVLRNAAENHLHAFQRGVKRLESGTPG